MSGSKKIQSNSLEERRTAFEWDKLSYSYRKQCALLGINRSSLYYEPKSVGQEEVELMHLIDEIYTKHPYYGRRRIKAVLERNGYEQGEKKIRNTMRKMGLEAIYPKRNLSQGKKEHKKYPYLLREKKIERPDQVWAADITYIRLVGGFGYLFAIIDWYSRYVIEWELSNLLDTEFCLRALSRGLERKRPEIFNTDQGVQFTSRVFTERLEEEGVQISMDGKGRALDNVMVERLWRSVKYEEVYPKGYEMLKEAKRGLEPSFVTTFQNNTIADMGGPDSVRLSDVVP